jgi:hypothetical protein
VTGIAAGAQQIAFGASSMETEGNQADNSLVLDVTVTSAAASGGGGGGGGGGADPWLWAALAPLVVWLRRRASAAPTWQPGRRSSS